MSGYQRLSQTVPSSIASGATDASSAATGTYIVSDMMGEVPLFVAASGSANAGYGGLTTPGGVPTLPVGYTAAAMASHPGNILIGTAALNDVAHGHVGATVNPYCSFFCASGGPSWQFSHLFGMPSVLSTAADRYIFDVGNIAGTATAIFGGFFLRYSDNLNSGNWQLYECYDQAAPTLIAASSVPPVALTWNKLTIAINNVTVTATLNGTQICSGTSTLMNTGNYIICSLGGIRMQRTAFTAGTIHALLDRSSAYAPLTR